MANDKENQDDSVTRAAIALLGDLAANLPATGPLLQGKAWVTHLLGQARTPSSSFCSLGISLHNPCSGHACRQPARHGAPLPGQGLGHPPAGPGAPPFTTSPSFCFVGTSLHHLSVLGMLAAIRPATGPLFQGKAWVTDLLGQARTPLPLHHLCFLGTSLHHLSVLGMLAAIRPATGPLFQGKAWVTDLLGQARTPYHFTIFFFWAPHFINPLFGACLPRSGPLRGPCSRARPGSPTCWARHAAMRLNCTAHVQPLAGTEC